MNRLLREESGMTLIEVLVVSSLMIVVLGAMLGAFETFQRTTNTNTKLNDSQDTVRVAVDSVTRELRNLASPTDELPDSVSRKDPGDLIFLSVAGNKPAGSLNIRNTRQVRYCVSSDGATIWREEQTWVSATAPGVPSGAPCGVSGDGWPTRRVLVTNLLNGAARPLFTYNNTDPHAVTEIGVSVFVDPDPGHSPKEVSLQSAVFLRNQNRKPTAEFDMQVSAGTFVLNASDSSDPEGRSLDLYWYDEARSDEGCGNASQLPNGIPAAGCIGTGLVFNYTPPVGGSRTIHVIAHDPAGLTATSTSKTCNSTGTGC